MGVLDQVMKMKKQGMEESEITQNLQEQGISPKAINDALNQADVKSAVSNNEPYENQNQETFSASSANQYPLQQTQEYAPQPEQDYYPQQQDYSQQEQGYYPQENYNQGYSQYPSAGDTSMTIEIAEQVFAEKMQKTMKQIDDLIEFKTMTESKVELLSERLKRIESTIDKLQLSILDKVGSYGKNLDSIKKEMSMMQDSFGKMVNKVADKNSSPAKTSVKTTTKKKVSKK